MSRCAGRPPAWPCACCRWRIKLRQLAAPSAPCPCLWTPLPPPPPGSFSLLHLCGICRGGRQRTPLQCPAACSTHHKHTSKALSDWAVLRLGFPHRLPDSVFQLHCQVSNSNVCCRFKTADLGLFEWRLTRATHGSHLSLSSMDVMISHILVMLYETKVPPRLMPLQHQDPTGYNTQQQAVRTQIVGMLVS